MSVVLIGRANVGKSTLFNRLIGRREALVHDTPGVTRDCREGIMAWGSMSCQLWDTAGLVSPKDSSLAQDLVQQTLFALRHARLALFVIDAREGLLLTDFFVAEWLRKHLSSEQIVCLIANKAEHFSASALASLNGELLRLGFGEPLFVSAEHNIGIHSIYDLLQHHFGDSSSLSETPETPIRIAIVGRPNVGKSTLVNAILKEQRLLTSATAGLTRDAISVAWRYKEQAFELVDTAGQRRQARITDPLELLATSKTRRITMTADIVCLVLDATIPVEKQDLTIGRRVIDRGIPPIVVLNKCDKVTNLKKVYNAAQEIVAQGLSQEKGIPIIAISAQEGTNVQQIFSWSLRLHRRAQTVLGTASLNRWLQESIRQYAPPFYKGKQAHLKYMTQIGHNPLSFLIFGTCIEAIPNSYRRYLMKKFVETFRLAGVPIKITFRQTENPYGRLVNKKSRAL
jgi:GTP-binding protein